MQALIPWADTAPEGAQLLAELPRAIHGHPLTRKPGLNRRGAEMSRSPLTIQAHHLYIVHGGWGDEEEDIPHLCRRGPLFLNHLVQVGATGVHQAFRLGGHAHQHPHYVPGVWIRLKKIPRLLTNTAGDVLNSRLPLNGSKFQLITGIQGDFDLFLETVDTLAQGLRAIVLGLLVF